MARGAYSGSGYAGDYNREHVLGGYSPSVSSKERQFAVDTLELLNSLPSDFADAGRAVIGAAAGNNVWSADQAARQMDYQTGSDRYAMSWSADQAAQNRAWQEEMSNTAHQREVKDLIAAGLNPVLSANTGAFTGAGAVGQAFSSAGAMGETDMSPASTLGSLFMQNINNANNRLITSMNNAAQQYSAEQNRIGSEALAGANIAAAQLNNEGALLRQNQDLSDREKQRRFDQQMQDSKYQYELTLQNSRNNSAETVAQLHKEGTYTGAAEKVGDKLGEMMYNFYDDLKKGNNPLFNIQKTY